MRNIWILFTLAAVPNGSVPGAGTPDAGRVLAPGEIPGDGRLGELKTHKTLRYFHAPDRPGEWLERKEELRCRILAACGLWPMPEKSPLHAEVFDRKDFGDYAVEKVLLETTAGYFLTGNLYRPSPATPGKRYPGVLCPHGHWSGGRFENTATGSIPGRAIGFARQGYVCFSYDMVGFGDNAQVLGDHRFGGAREALWGIHPAGLQLWNSIRALDFVESLDDVDAGALGCTGASGGGTQTFLLAAVDERVKVAAPVNMISHSMQGGCKCENPPHLRLETDNMEIGAMTAPRPLMLVCATGDWTKKTPEIEFPAIRSVYALLGAEERIGCHLVDAGHNYNKESREAVFAWFGRWFYPERPTEHCQERDFTVPSREDLSVVAGRDPPPGLVAPDELYAALRAIRERQFSEFLGTDMATFERSYGRAFRIAVGVREPEPGEIRLERSSSRTIDSVTLEVFLLCNDRTGQRIPANLWLPGGGRRKKLRAPVLLVHPEGKAGLLSPDGGMGESLASYLRENRPVLGIDCLGTGEFLADGSHWERGKGIEHSSTYNLTDAACRIQDILLAETYLAGRFGIPPVIVGLRGAGGDVLLAHGLAERSGKTVADLGGLDFDGDVFFTERMNIPLIRRAGDFATSIIIGAGRPVEWSGCEDASTEARLDVARKTARRWSRP